MMKFLLLALMVMCCRGDPPLEDAPPSEVRNQDSPDYFEPGRASEDCVCVPWYLCVDGEIVEDGSNIIDPRRKPQTEELGLEEVYTPPECGPYHVCCKNPESSTVRPYEHRCGMRNPGGLHGRILNSQRKGEAGFGEWPWQAAILMRSGYEFIFKCGGTLIDKRHVITVAHCAEHFLKNPEDLVIRLGEWDTQKDDEDPPHEDHDVQEIILHPQYRKSNLFNDIAILKMVDEVSFKPHIDTACLPHDDDDFTGHDCVATGWGTNAYKHGTFSVKMKEVTMPVLSHADCQALLRRTRLGPRFKLYSGFLCAGGKQDEDSCKGDGGGPLVCYRAQDNSYTVAGLVSWGIDCGQRDVPGVYVNVHKYRDWITSITGKALEDYWNELPAE